MPGIITIWHGTLVSIPDGWALCNGTQGTPDLQDRFVINFGPDYSLWQTGGEIRHSHVVTIDPHTHSIMYGPPEDINPLVFEIDRRHSNSAVDTGYTSLARLWPPYYAFAYIMKL